MHLGLIAAAVPPETMRPTSLALNVLAAGYASWRLNRARAIEWRLLGTLVIASLPCALLGGLIVLPGRTYLTLAGVLLLAAAGATVFRRSATAENGGPGPAVSAALAGAATGFLSGLTGVGGGVFPGPPRRVPRLVFATPGGGIIRAVHLHELDIGSRRCARDRAASGAGIPDLCRRDIDGRCHRHGHWPALDVSSRYAPRPRVYSSRCRCSSAAWVSSLVVGKFGERAAVRNAQRFGSLRFRGGQPDRTALKAGGVEIWCRADELLPNLSLQTVLSGSGCENPAFGLDGLAVLQRFGQHTACQIALRLDRQFQDMRKRDADIGIARYLVTAQVDRLVLRAC